MKEFIQKSFKLLGYRVSELPDGDLHVRAPGHSMLDEILAMQERVLTFTAVSKKRGALAVVP